MNRPVDLSDPQWRDFRQGVFPLSVAMFCYVFGSVMVNAVIDVIKPSLSGEATFLSILETIQFGLFLVFCKIWQQFIVE